MALRDLRPDAHFTHCEPCDKRLFVEKSRAKATIRRLHEPGMRPYRCPEWPGMWHIGHLPENVRRGRVTADDCYPKPGRRDG